MNKRKQAALAAAVLGAWLLFPAASWAQETTSTGLDEESEAAADPSSGSFGEDSESEADQDEAEDLSTTGDAWVDAQLADIGRYARRYPETFADELQRYHDAPRASVNRLIEAGWAPGDVYFACALGSVTGRACRFVIDQRGNPPQTGWRALAEDLGAAPGSQAFARLKRGIVESYGRWARPLELDAELARAFPDHPRPGRPQAGD